MNLRLPNMMKIALSVLLLASNFAVAQWSSLVTTDYENGRGYKDVRVTPSVAAPGVEEACVVKVKAYEYQHKSAWLILTSRELSEEEQDLSWYVHNAPSLRPTPRSKGKEPDIKGELIQQSHLIIKDKSKAISIDLQTDSFDDAYYKFSISRAAAQHAYVYIDMPSLMVDSGYRYSINIGSYCKKIIH
jgi:hypothetical protein